MLAILMRSFLCFPAVFFLSCSPAATPDDSGAESRTSSSAGQAVQKRADDDTFDRVLKTAVKNGKVDYKVLRSATQELDSYVAHVAEFDLKSLKTKNEKLAFFVNAYNANVLKMVRDRPKIVSVVKVDGFFDKLKVKVAGSQLTLNELEGKARALGDPRVHFAVNCASGSCPILETKAFRAQGLDARLTQATRRYLLDKTFGLQIDTKKREAHLSEIFNWYGKDFDSSGKPQDMLKWIAKQLGGDIQKQLDATPYTVIWKKYDWSLNSK